MIVAALVATVTFAAGFTLPGGYNDNGMAILTKRAAFKAFIVTDTIAVILSVSAFTKRADGLLSFCLDYPMEPFSSHSVKLIFSYIVTILRWSYLRCIDSYIIISMKYMSNILYIPMELFSSYQDRPDALVSILGHIFLF